MKAVKVNVGFEQNNDQVITSEKGSKVDTVEDIQRTSAND